MEESKATNPVDIRLLGADAVTLRAQHVPDLIAQSSGFAGRVAMTNSIYCIYTLAPPPLLINCKLGSTTHIQQPVAVRKSRGKIKKPLLVHCYKNFF